MTPMKEISPYELNENPFGLIGKDLMLITAQKEGKINTMTAGWGCLGYLWRRPVCICYVRPQRYTYEFTEAAEGLSLTFFDESYRDMLHFCGTASGRDCDKIARAGLTPVIDETTGIPYFEEARLTLLCKKLYIEDLKEENFLDKSLLANYPAGDFHRAYICEIEKVLVKPNGKEA